MSQAINVNNDEQMVHENLRVPLLKIDRKIFKHENKKESNVAKLSYNAIKKSNPQLVREAKEINIKIILNSRVTFNCILLPLNKKF